MESEIRTSDLNKESISEVSLTIFQFSIYCLPKSNFKKRLKVLFCSQLVFKQTFFLTFLKFGLVLLRNFFQNVFKSSQIYEQFAQNFNK